MTIEEFISELAGASDQFQWVLAPDQIRQPERRAQTRTRLRGKPLAGQAKDQELDPLIAVCYARTGLRQPWLRAMEELGLSPGAAESVVAAANDCTWKGDPEARVPQDNLVALRARIIQAVGLRVSAHASDEHRRT